MNKIKDETYNLIEKMTLKNFQWSFDRIQPKWVGAELELDSIFMLSSKVNAMS